MINLRKLFLFIFIAVIFFLLQGNTIFNKKLKAVLDEKYVSCNVISVKIWISILVRRLR